MAVARVAFCLLVAAGSLARAADPPPAADPIDPLAKPTKPIVTVPEFEAMLKPGGIDQLDKDYPLPQDPKTIQKVRSERLKQLRAETVGVFDAHGNTKAPWADKARAAMEAYCLAQTRSAVSTTGVYVQAFREALKAAAQDKCDDPLIVYWLIRLLPRPAPPLPEHLAAAEGLAKSKYTRFAMHAAYNAYAYTVFLVQQKAAGATAADATARYQQVLTALKPLATEKTTANWSEVVQFLNMDIGRRMRPDKDRLATWKETDDWLSDVGADPWVRNALHGRVLVTAGWDARGGGTIDTVTADGLATFRDRLQEAVHKLEAAWELNATLDDPATDMVMLSRGGQIPRNVMEVWFRRAMETNPDNLQACEHKKEYLQPKWGGSNADAFGFVYQCLRTNNFYAHIPYLAEVPFAHDLPFGDPVGMKDYVSRRQTWPLVKLVNEAQVARYPDDVYARTRYAQRACLFQKWGTADAQFKALDGKSWPGFFAKDELTRMIQKAKEEAAKD